MSVDLTNCDQEPIHTPGAIQPVGLLLSFGVRDLELQHYSQNSGEFFHGSVEPGQPLDRFFTPETVEELEELRLSTDATVYPLVLQCRRNGGVVIRGGAAHVYLGQLIVEIEVFHRPDDEVANPLTLPVQFKRALTQMQNAPTMDDLYDTIARHVQRFNRFDRVMVYRFLKGGHGQVVGETARPDLESFLGLHYPATDIPAQARRLYELNPVRLIGDIEAPTVPILPEVHPQTHRPLDLTYSYFRAVSPIHIQYLRNMGVRASMSISILRDGQLWGLIACHHYSRRFLSIEQRIGCEVFGMMAASYVTTRERNELGREMANKRTVLQKVLVNLSENESLHRGLETQLPFLQELIPCDGVALCWGSSTTSDGMVPTMHLLQELKNHVPADAAVWHTEELSAVVPECAFQKEQVCGALVLKIDSPDLKYVMFFRRQYSCEVTWAGNVDEFRKDPADVVSLTPRHSFEAWKQIVSGRSRDWSAIDLEIAETLRTSVVELQIRRASEIARLNAELQKINADLDSFAYAASHDLREPLRGLNQTIFLMLSELDAETKQRVHRRLDALQRLTRRMGELIEGLLRLSRVGRADLELAPISVDEAATEAAEMVFGKPFPSDVKLTIGQLGADVGDYLCIRELFTNLLLNARKYSDNPIKSIEIGVADPEIVGPQTDGNEKVYFVRDDGIGIAESAHAAIFQAFRRLHLPEAYGGGSGAGLAIVKKIVERHGGKIWVQSQVGQGTTFFFTMKEA